MPHDPYKALYVHLPFCVSRCAYCDFVTQALHADSPEIDAYIDELCLQIRAKAKEGELASVETVYLGGGTPSHVGSARLSKLLYLLGVSLHLTPESEVTMEANPESLTVPMVKDIWALGVNRLSIGVQSFDDDVLQVLGRAHSAARARDAIAEAHERFENVSIDLMCGVPGQSRESFVSSLQDAIDLGVTHVSIYPLTIERGTPFDKLLMRGAIEEPDEDEQAFQMSLAKDILGKAGFSRYEVASYARPGFECRHNVAYWTGVPYLGFGRSAVSMTQNAERRMRMQDGIPTDDLNAHQMMAEDLMMGMRMTRGVSDEQVEAAERAMPTRVLPVFEELCELGLAQHDGNRFTPTEQGWLCGNELYGRIFDIAP